MFEKRFVGFKPLDPNAAVCGSAIIAKFHENMIRRSV